MSVRGARSASTRSRRRAGLPCPRRRAAARASLVGSRPRIAHDHRSPGMPKPTTTVRSTRRRAPARPADARPSSRRGAIRLVVADGRAIDRAALAALLRADPQFAVLAEAGTVEDALRDCRRHEPDVLVLTLTLPGVDERPALTHLLDELPDLKIVAISERGWSDCLVLNPPGVSELPVVGSAPLCASGTDCLELAAAQGALATVRRSADPSVLREAIVAAAAGNSRYEPANVASREAMERGRRLSRRELVVGALIARGHSNKEIATALDVSEPTVKKHVGHLLEKLGVLDRL